MRVIVVKASQVSPCCVQVLSLVHMYTVLEAEEDSPTHFKHVVFMPEQAFMALFILGQMCGGVCGPGPSASTWPLLSALITSCSCRHVSGYCVAVGDAALWQLWFQSWSCFIREAFPQKASVSAPSPPLGYLHMMSMQHEFLIFKECTSKPVDDALFCSHVQTAWLCW